VWMQEEEPRRERRPRATQGAVAGKRARATAPNSPCPENTPQLTRLPDLADDALCVGGKRMRAALFSGDLELHKGLAPVFVCVVRLRSCKASTSLCPRTGSLRTSGST
jgi:hypothetical protein